jgi:hypothetical protein
MQNAEPVLGEASRPNRAACALDLEGIVAKRLDDVYEPLIDGHNRNDAKLQFQRATVKLLGRVFPSRSTSNGVEFQRTGISSKVRVPCKPRGQNSTQTFANP